MTFTLLNADAIEAMQAMAENSVDAIVTDPPYGIHFMGKTWDQFGGAVGVDHKTTSERSGSMHAGLYDLSPTANRQFQAWTEAWAREALRVLKPGGHLLSSCSTRTYHRMAAGIEDAGFEIRDCIAWMYGSGFPKSLDVSKAIDKANGVDTTADERWVPTPHFVTGAMKTIKTRSDKIGQATPGERHLYDPSSDDAQRWNGWGTALKPAFEPIVLARKPLSERNVAANVQRWGTGSINVDGCRIGAGEGGTRDGEASAERRYTANGSSDFAATPGPRGGAAEGRWPANVVLDPVAAAMLDEQTGERPSAGTYTRSLEAPPTRKQLFGSDMGDQARDNRFAGETGGASRFFYCPKADREERNRGLGHMADQVRPAPFNDRTRACNVCGSRAKEPGPDARWPNCPHDDWSWVGVLEEPHKGRAQNTHPTVKPVELMRWLCRMVTPKGGTVLDPFTGSGSTGVAAMREGFEFIGIEREAEYVEIARSRIIGDAPLFNVEAEPSAPEKGEHHAERSIRSST